MGTKRPDWISIIEAGYDLEGSDPEWLRRLVGQAAPVLNRGSEPVAWTFRCTPSSFKLLEFSAGTSRTLIGLARACHAVASQASLDLTYRTGAIIATASDLIFPRLPEMQKMFMKLIMDRGRDLFVITCLDAGGSGVCLGILLKHTSAPTAEERRSWPQIAVHIGAAMRLRNFWRDLSLDSMPVEAILDSGGKVHAARGPAQATDAREKLREVVRRIERSRAQLRGDDAVEALRNWEGLVNGRWSIVDKFDTDGRRFVVAVKNDPIYPDRRGLTERERQVAELVGWGKASNEIAYALGVSETAITNCTARAQAKLGLNSRAELVAFFAHNGLRRKLAEIAVADEKLLIGAYPLIDERAVAKLSDAERVIVAHVVAGSTNSDIARRRGTSEHTIANQMQAIFRKLQVRSRGELVVRLRSGI